MAGRILDADPGLVGYQHLYMLMAIFAAIGLIAIFGLRQLKNE